MAASSLLRDGEDNTLGIGIALMIVFSGGNKKDIYLVMVGVQPGEQARGLGHRMVQDAIERTRNDRRAVGIARDTENEDNVRLYERWGFRKVASLQLGRVEAPSACSAHGRRLASIAARVFPMSFRT